MTDTPPEPGLPKNLQLVFHRISEQLEAYYNGPYRSDIAKAQRDEEDLFMLLVHCESLGIPNPVSLYTLELQPLLLERFHQWHQRMGMERSPLDELRCC
ncbi:cory-CC-star protein [Microbulbifer bruguierae]|uniref:Cory-CC-star protein n=1 Tax=Microbulbifer bruguierae TaxID=3029061 RepID=A0ABY8NDE7_9GAMM|nr:cory-CC-star protein [Microbulbifer bruguierae]WGL16941.1 cory-CC-star protein [Microbulbifer bruguierae]